MIIDSHQHFWKLDLPFDYDWLKSAEHAPIHHDYLPEDLLVEMRRAGVDRAVFVQTQHNLEENRWALELAERNPWIAGIVGWVDLTSDQCEAQLAEFTSHRRFVGIRHITQDEPDDDFLISAPVLRGLRVLEKHAVPFDLLLHTRHLRHVPTLATQLPTLPMVIDHLAKPHIRARQLDAWSQDFRRAAEHPNVYCKLSGMVTEADWYAWKPADLKPYVDTALDCFGPERCMFGSDWPVCELAASYRDVVETLRGLLAGLSASEQASIFGRTAKQFYQLSPAAEPSAASAAER
ncbi:amidohydrolase family protein [Candidatus Laterigemmans baculatus]|uniref:amidohydrolase family protein n=1 Tax=Candidatus Laterigemmans baculatus TaxID=2770505 RepID=UPI0013DC9EC2|nr:amidohydrolase family protein [Candidatus Laterigemmans baculatus]